MKESHITITPLQIMEELMVLVMQVRFSRKHIVWINFSDLTEMNSLSHVTKLNEHHPCFQFPVIRLVTLHKQLRFICYLRNCKIFLCPKRLFYLQYS